MDGWTLAATLIASTAPIVGAIIAVPVIDYQRRRSAGEESSVTRRQAQRARPYIRFARDVSVNVIANLAAAAIIYLLGSAAGLLPRSPQLIFTSVFVVVMTAGFGLGVAGLALRGNAKIYTSGAALIVLGAAGVLAPFIKDSGLTTWEKSWLPIASAATFTLGWIIVIFNRKMNRLRDSDSA